MTEVEQPDVGSTPTPMEEPTISVAESLDLDQPPTQNCEPEKVCLFERIKRFWHDARYSQKTPHEFLYGIILFKHKIVKGTRDQYVSPKKERKALAEGGEMFDSYSLESLSPEEQAEKLAGLEGENLAAKERERRGLSIDKVGGKEALAIICASGAAPTKKEAQEILSKSSWTDSELQSKLTSTYHPEDTPRYLVQGLRGMSNKGSLTISRSRLMAYLMTGDEALTQEEATKFIEFVGQKDMYDLEELINKIIPE